MSDYYGQGGRLSKRAHSALVQTAYQHDAEDAELLMPGLHIVDLAHIVALHKAGALSEERAREVASALLRLSERTIPIIPELGDVYNSKEHALKEMIGDRAGWLHMGRARREAVNSSFLLALKAQTISTYNAVLELLNTFTKIAAEHRTTLMPDFTYLLHAQPTYLGHYLGTYLGPLSRDLDRIQSFYQRLDQSWAGIGSINGTRIPIDRTFLAELMGFARAADHTRDAMWMPDICNEAIGCIATLMSGLNRFVEELIVWNTQEFRFIEIDDGFARSSVIMPQKKNPYPLAYFRGLTKSVIGKVGTYLQLGSTASGFPESRTFIYGDLLRTLNTVSAALLMLSELVASLSWKQDRMRTTALEGYAYAMDAAELLSQHQAIDYKTSHYLVGQVVRSKPKDAKEFSDQLILLLESQEMDVLPEFISALQTIGEPSNLIDQRNALGAASPSAQDIFLETMRSSYGNHRQSLTKIKEAYQSGTALLNSHLKNLNIEEFRPINPSYTT